MRPMHSGSCIIVLMVATPPEHRAQIVGRVGKVKRRSTSISQKQQRPFTFHKKIASSSVIYL